MIIEESYIYINEKSYTECILKCGAMTNVDIQCSVQRR
jgi:hypothetical protein